MFVGWRTVPQWNRLAYLEGFDISKVLHVEDNCIAVTTSHYCVNMDILNYELISFYK